MSLKATLTVIVFFALLSGFSSQEYCQTSKSVQEFCPFGCCGSGNCRYCCENKIAIGVGSAVAIAVVLMISSGFCVFCIQRRYADAFDRKDTKSIGIQTKLDKHAVQKAEPPPQDVLKRVAQNRRESIPPTNRATGRRQSTFATSTLGIPRSRQPSAVSKYTNRRESVNEIIDIEDVDDSLSKGRTKSNVSRSRQPSAVSRYTNRRESVNERINIEDADDSLSRGRTESNVSGVRNQEDLINPDTEITSEQVFDQRNEDVIDETNLNVAEGQDVEIINEEDLV